MFGPVKEGQARPLLLVLIPQCGALEDDSGYLSTLLTQVQSKLQWGSMW